MSFSAYSHIGLAREPPPSFFFFDIRKEVGMCLSKSWKSYLCFSLLECKVIEYLFFCIEIYLERRKDTLVGYNRNEC